MNVRGSAANALSSLSLGCSARRTQVIPEDHDYSVSSLSSVPLLLDDCSQDRDTPCAEIALLNGPQTKMTLQPNISHDWLCL